MNKKIMTVDDSASIRQMVSFTLRGAGYEVVEASDGEDALAMLAANRIHMIITDLNMPRLNGLDLVRRVREMPSLRFIPIIMLTTESIGEKSAACKEAGATGWIVKPFKPAQLLAVVEKVMGCQTN
ncbi:MAG: response regulator [Nitrospirae bacterium]|nr:response regulator [Nitrospirota bacterium]